MSFTRKNDPKILKQEINKRDTNQMAKDFLSDSSSSTNTSSNIKQQRQKEAMQKLASNFKKKTSEKKQSADSWQNLIQNLINSQRGKLPLLLAVEAGNQSMVRELLSAQTAEQLKVSKKTIFTFLQIHLVKDCDLLPLRKRVKFVGSTYIVIQSHILITTVFLKT